MVHGLIHGLLIAGTTAPALAAVSAATWLAVLYARAVREDNKDQETNE